MKNVIVVQEDEGLFNVFDRAMFDENGYLDGYEAVYHESGKQVRRL